MEKDMKAVMQKPKEFVKPHIAENFYVCECIDVKRVSDGQYGKRIAFIARILEMEGIELAKVVYDKLTPESGAMGILEGFGVKFVEGLEFDYSDLLGKQAIAVVEDYKYIINGEEKVASTITKFKKIHTEPLKKD